MQTHLGQWEQTFVEKTVFQERPSCRAQGVFLAALNSLELGRFLMSYRMSHIHTCCIIQKDTVWVVRETTLSIGLVLCMWCLSAGYILKHVYITFKGKGSDFNKFIYFILKDEIFQMFNFLHSKFRKHLFSSDQSILIFKVFSISDFYSCESQLWHYLSIIQGRKGPRKSTDCGVRGLGSKFGSATHSRALWHHNVTWHLNIYKSQLSRVQKRNGRIIMKIKRLCCQRNLLQATKPCETNLWLD